MSLNAITRAGLDVSLLQGARTGQTFQTQAVGGDFLALLNERLGDFKSRALDILLGNSPDNSAADVFALPGMGQASAAGLSAGGRNLALFDPESAFRMMSEINQREVNYKAEFAEMNDMGAYVETMRTAARSLASLDGESSNAAIREGLQEFVATYNGWIDRFDEALARGGLLAGTQAATVAQWELEKSVDSVFHGAAGGVRGMTALGISIDPVSNMASLDPARLDAMLAANPNGAIAAIREFSSHFARSAELLNSSGNFIPNRMNNLSRVIDYLNENKSALQTEFGLGDAARPSGEVARALAAYNAMRGTAT